MLWLCASCYHTLSTNDDRYHKYNRQNERHVCGADISGNTLNEKQKDEILTENVCIARCRQLWDTGASAAP